MPARWTVEWQVQGRRAARSFSHWDEALALLHVLRAERPEARARLYGDTVSEGQQPSLLEEEEEQS